MYFNICKKKKIILFYFIFCKFDVFSHLKEICCETLLLENRGWVYFKIFYESVPAVQNSQKAIFCMDVFYFDFELYNRIKTCYMTNNIYVLHDEIMVKCPQSDFELFRLYLQTFMFYLLKKREHDSCLLITKTYQSDQKSCWRKL